VTIFLSSGDAAEGFHSPGPRVKRGPMVAKDSERSTAILRTIPVDAKSVRKQYRGLREKLLSSDRAAEAHLLYITEGGGGRNNEEDVEELTVGVGQMVAYLESKVGSSSEEKNLAMLGGPFVNFLETLQTRGLSIRWAIAASALSLVEVITNQALAKFSLDDSGEFDKRLNRLSSALKQKNVEIPSLLLSGLYKVRSKVIHEGREPTAEEMTTIFQLLNSLHEKTK
jgi:hypothetical protein